MTQHCPHCKQPLPKEHGIVLDKGTVSFNGQSVALPPGLFELMEYLVRNIGKWCTKERIQDWLFQLDPNGDGPEGENNFVNVRIYRLRRAIRPLDLYIESRQGSGQGWKLHNPLTTEKEET